MHELPRGFTRITGFQPMQDCTRTRTKAYDPQDMTTAPVRSLDNVQTISSSRTTYGYCFLVGLQHCLRLRTMPSRNNLSVTLVSSPDASDGSLSCACLYYRTGTGYSARHKAFQFNPISYLALFQLITTLLPPPSHLPILGRHCSVQSHPIRPRLQQKTWQCSLTGNKRIEH